MYKRLNMSVSDKSIRSQANVMKIRKRIQTRTSDTKIMF